MYTTVLWLHSWWRWVVLLSGLLAVLHAWVGVFARRAYTPGARRLALFFTSALDIQFLFGFTLYVFLSPYTRVAFENMRAAMREPNLRWWSVEHGPTMLVVLLLAHVASVRARRAPTDLLRYRRFAVWASCAFVLMFFAVPWPWLDVARPLGR